MSELQASRAFWTIIGFLQHPMLFSLNFNRQTFCALLLVTTFVSVLYLDSWIKYISGHRQPFRVVGRFNQGPLHDVSAAFEGSRMSVATEVPNVLEELRKDGYTPKSVSNTTNRSLLEAAKHPRSHVNQTNLTSQFLVPKVVHYVFMGSDLEFTLVNYLSFLSVERFVRPFQIFVHGDVVPAGKWWDRAVKEVKNIYHVRRPYMDTAPNDKPLKYSAHASDYIRAEILVRYGGVYLDGDVLVLKSFDPLLKYHMVLGRETHFGVCNGIMIACKGAPFMRLMLEQYRSYQGYDEEWAMKSVENIHRLVEMYPHLVHLEETTLNRPNWMEKVFIYHLQYDWSDNYAVHLYIRSWPGVMRPSSLEEVLTIDSTFGEMARAIFYGSDRSDGNVSRWTGRQLQIGLLLQL